MFGWLQVSRDNGGYFGCGHNSARGPIGGHHLLVDLHVDGPLVVSGEALASMSKLFEILMGNVMLSRPIFLVHHNVLIVCDCLDRIISIHLVLIVGLEEATDAVAFVETGCIDLDHVMNPFCLGRYLGCDAHACGRYLSLIVCPRAYH